MPRLLAAVTGTRSCMSTSGGVISACTTFPCASAMRTAIPELAVCVAIAKAPGCGAAAKVPEARAEPLPPVIAPTRPVSTAETSMT